MEKLMAAPSTMNFGHSKINSGSVEWDGSPIEHDSRSGDNCLHIVFMETLRSDPGLREKHLL